jgi:hypothetical protein
MSLFDEMNDDLNKKDNNKVKGTANKKDNKNVNKKDNKVDEKQELTPVSEETVKTTKFVESLLNNKKKEEKELVGFRIRKSTNEAIEAIVKQSDVKKSEFVDEILRKALGLN